MPRQHVFAPEDSQEGRQAGGRVVAEACSASGRDQRLAGAGLAPIDRSVGRAGRSTADAGAVSGRSLRGGILPGESIVGLKLSELRLCRPRQWGGAGWLAMSLWEELQLGRFW